MNGLVVLLFLLRITNIKSIRKHRARDSDTPRKRHNCTGVGVGVGAGGGELEWRDHLQGLRDVQGTLGGISVVVPPSKVVIG